MDQVQMNENQQIFQEIVKFVEGWRTLTVADITILNTVGITNKTYIVVQNKGKDAQPEKVIFRSYGEECVGLYLDRSRELQVIEQLCALQLSPRYFGATSKVINHLYHSKIRVEEFLPNRVIQVAEMRDQFHYRRVAFNLARFHQAQIDNVSKSPLVDYILDPEGVIFKRVRDKLDTFEFPESDRSRVEALKGWLSNEETQFLLGMAPKGEDSVCFSHNDLLANNILVVPPNEEVVFIDFEYSAYNYRAFDIGNYFFESSFDYNNPNPPYFHLAPTETSDEVVRDFISVYALANLGLITFQEIDQDHTLKIEGLPPNHKYFQLVKELTEQFPLANMWSAFLWGYVIKQQMVGVGEYT